MTRGAGASQSARNGIRGRPLVGRSAVAVGGRRIGSGTRLMPPIDRSNLARRRAGARSIALHEGGRSVKSVGVIVGRGARLSWGGWSGAQLVIASCREDQVLWGHRSGGASQ
jgi:hypothetical protein